ncbi:cytochrome P450 [Biscogniauxia marginata]|nr:cytochrome P450 [Biscogniauxia marginata]
MPFEHYFNFKRNTVSPSSQLPSRGLFWQGLIVILSLYTIYHIALVIYRIWFHPLSKFPGPKHLAATNLIWMWKSYITGTSQLELKKLHRQYGPIVRISANRLDVDGSIGWAPIFGHQRGGKPEFWKPAGSFFQGDHHSILTARQETHRRLRRHLSHAFSDSALHEQEDLIMGYVNLLVKRLGEQADAGTPTNIVRWLNFTAFDIIGDLSFGDSFHSLEDNDYHPWILTLFQSIKGEGPNRIAKAYPLLGALFMKWIYRGEIAKSAQNREYSVTKAKARMELGVEPNGGRRDFMTYLMKTKGNDAQSLSELEILSHSSMFVVAGSETTATALSGLFFYVGRDQKIYEDLANEIRNAFNDETEINMQNTVRLEFLNACLNEVLRVYPPATDPPPRVSPGGEIEGKYLPPGVLIGISQVATMSNPLNFHEPEAFRPQRWLPPTDPRYDPVFANDNHAAFKPFSYGPRDCLGKNLAYAEMRLIMSKIFFKYDFRLEPGQSNWHSSQKTFTIWDKAPLSVVLTRREAVA